MLDHGSTPDAASASSYLEWTVKKSLHDYVAGTEDGNVDWLAPATEGWFPCVSVSVAGPRSVAVITRGSVRFCAHGGLMDLELRDLAVTIEGGALRLHVASPAGGEGVLFATQDGVRARRTDAGWEFEADAPELTIRGSSILGGVYPLGTALDPLRLVIRAAHNDPARPSEHQGDIDV